MKPNLDMIVFGEDWGEHPSSTQHLIKYLSKDRKILWFNSIGLRRPKFNFYDLNRCFAKIIKCVQGLLKKPIKEKISIEIPENISIINALVIPVPLNKIEHFLNNRLLSRSIQKNCDKNGIKKSVLWMTLPTAIDSIGQSQEELSIYYCCDDFSSLAGVDHKPVEIIENNIIDKVDIIITSNKNLSHKFPAEKTHYIPHGVDYDLFSKPAKRAYDMPKGKKIAGFYGAIHDWLDVDLLVEAANRLPEWTFVFVGPVYTDIDELKILPNVHFLGQKQHHYLPSYVQHWDIAMLAFNNCEQIRHCNPLKLREYMASGTAVLSTDFPAAREYEQDINIACDKNEFIQFFDKIDTLETKMKQAQAQQKMQNESWASRAKEIEGIIYNYLK